MRLIDADALEAKIMMEAPDFMDGGSSLTKAFIMAMVKTKSAAPEGGSYSNLGKE